MTKGSNKTSSQKNYHKENVPVHFSPEKVMPHPKALPRRTPGEEGRGVDVPYSMKVISSFGSKCVQKKEKKPKRHRTRANLLKRPKPTKRMKHSVLFMKSLIQKVMLGKHM